MTVTTDTTASDTQSAVSGAIETTDRIASHLHPVGSFNLDDHAVPKGLEEIWRFTPLKRLRGLHNGTYSPDGKVVAGVEADDRVRVETVGRDDARLGSVYAPGDRISAQAWTSFSEATVVTVPAETEIDEPVVLSVHGDSAEQAAFGHVFLDLEQFSEATIILDHTGNALLAANVEVRIGDGARLTLLSMQDWDDDAVHVAHHHAVVGRDATYKHVAVSFGGDLVRLNSSVEYGSTGGDVTMLGLYFADEDQHLEHRLFVDHNRPNGRSHVDYKGALQGEKAHTVWIGDVLIRKSGEGIETYESNDNLILTDGCRADSVPNLEIETGEIAGAGHASTTGRFDDQHLFYLQSRGIPEDEARRLVVYGFFNDIIRRIGVPQIESRLLRAVEGELEKNIGVAAATSEPGPA